MIYLLNIFVLGLISFLTLSFLPNLRIFGVIPFLPVLFVLSLSYFRKGFEPVILAAAVGIIFDCFSPYPFGFYLSIFLLAVGLTRFLFQEGMRTLTLGSYLFVSFTVLGVYFFAQIIILYLQKASLGLNLFWAGVAFLGVNLVCVILVYAFSVWYFEAIARLNNYLKRR